MKNIRLKKKKEREELDKKIKDLKEMTLIDYLQHIRDEKETKLIWDKRYHTKTEELLEEDEETVAKIVKQ